MMSTPPPLPPRPPSPSGLDQDKALVRRTSFFDTPDGIMSRMANSCRHNVIDLGARECPEFPSALVRPGEFIMMETHPEGPDGFSGELGQVIDMADFRDIPSIEVNQAFNRFRDPKDRMVLIRLVEPLSFHASCKNKINPSDYTFIHETQQEVILSCRLRWLSPFRIDCIAFIFHPDFIEAGVFQTAGITNAFMCNKIALSDDTYMTIEKDSDYLKPFFSPYNAQDPKTGKDIYTVETYSRRMWNYITAANVITTRKMAGKKGNWEGRTQRCHLPGWSKEFYEFIVGEMSLMKQTDQIDFILEDIVLKRAKKVHSPDLSVAKKKRAMNVSLFRILEEKELDQGRRVLGSTFGVATTKNAPTLADVKAAATAQKPQPDTLKLETGDQVRIVTCAAQEKDVLDDRDRRLASAFVVDDEGAIVKAPYDRKGKQPMYLSFPGIDILYEDSYSFTNMQFAMKFKKLLGSSSSVLKALNAGKPVPAVAEARMESINDDNLAVGDEFRYRDLLYCVTSIDPENKRVGARPTWEDSDDDETILELEEATVLVAAEVTNSTAYRGMTTPERS
ncbi:hypothetical protein SEMRO_250_G098930.1 [Seminavis robusta]|uniref:Uncharacterized protein n=1 Tax=Seminavis robusta TaxID=568900 RepID=A0A9N8DPA1_9STRA|nr:hypothetical protein SEMRO_250_G098930.1 [Seminavis robusta]|eukprot:Sro250_g098930.1 n/a (563) ;mRNA; f:16323-18011